MICQSFDEAASIITSWKKNDLKIVFTNGCFDLIHYGHISYLLEAKALGDKLIVGLNSDSSVKQLKGNQRPIKDQKNRSYILNHLDMVDLVIIFDAETPKSLIASVLPHILVKGGDYEIRDIVGAQTVLNNGGSVERLSFEQGYSSSSLIEKIKNTL